VRSRRLELPRAFAHNDLNVARLPIPPRPLNQRGGKSLRFRAPRGGRSGPLAKGAGGRKLETRVNPHGQSVPAGDGAIRGVADKVNRAFTFGDDAADRLGSCRRNASSRPGRAACAKWSAGDCAGNSRSSSRRNLKPGPGRGWGEAAGPPPCGRADFSRIRIRLKSPVSSRIRPSCRLWVLGPAPR
jgi:hypothetical protein